ncbi:hypothetical protein N8368_00540 [Bacteroidia bacterium]|nr:hypothetical protein [Bacteroidia bacterium]
MKIAMLSCKQSSILSEKQELVNLSIVESIKLKMHAKMCTASKSLSIDNKLIDQAVLKILEQRKEQNMSLTAAQREKILQALR